MQTKLFQTTGLLTAFIVLGSGIVAAPSATAQNDQNGRSNRYDQYDRNDRNDRNDRRRGGASSWADLSGRPRIRVGREAGFFIWHDGRTVHLMTTDTNDGRNLYKGEITIEGGHFNDLRREAGSINRSDKVNRPEQTRITFEFDTQRDSDGLRFDVVDGNRITFRLSRDGRNGDRVYVGPDKRLVTGDTLTFNLHR